MAKSSLKSNYFLLKTQRHYNSKPAYLSLIAHFQRHTIEKGHSFPSPKPGRRSIIHPLKAVSELLRPADRTSAIRLDSHALKKLFCCLRDIRIIDSQCRTADTELRWPKSASQITEMPYFVESLRQHMKQEPPYELLSGNGHYLSFVFFAVILPDECDSAILHR